MLRAFKTSCRGSVALNATRQRASRDRWTDVNDEKKSEQKIRSFSMELMIFLRHFHTRLVPEVCASPHGISTDEIRDVEGLSLSILCRSCVDPEARYEEFIGTA